MLSFFGFDQIPREILALTIWWHPCVKSSLVLLEKGVCFDQCVFLAKVCFLGKTLFCPASFTPRPNLPVTPDISWPPTFAFQSPMMKRHLFWVLVLGGLVGLHRTVQTYTIMPPANSDRVYFWGSKITADGDCSHEIRRLLLLGIKAMTNLDSILKSRDTTLATKVRSEEHTSELQSR